MANFDQVTQGKTANNHPTEHKDQKYTWLFVGALILAATLLAAAIAWYFFTFHIKPERNANPSPRTSIPVSRPHEALS